MNKLYTRRTVPASAVALSAISVLTLLQVFVIAGGMEIKASTVKRIAPFAYEPFLKLMGEHPSMISSRMAAKKDASAEKSSDSGVATIAGFRPEELSVEIEGVENAALEPVVPVEENAPVEKPEPPPQEKKPVDDDVPVG